MFKEFVVFMNKLNLDKVEVLHPSKELKDKVSALENELISEYKELIHYVDIPLQYYGDIYIHTLMSKKINPKKPYVIMLHGLQGNSSIFHAFVPHLTDSYNVICLDFPGMAFSARPQVDFKTCVEWLEYFVDFLKVFSDNMQIKQFHLIGHSLGGLISGWYALKYPETLIKLSLFSPAGITNPDNNTKILEQEKELNSKESEDKSNSKNKEENKDPLTEGNVDSVIKLDKKEPKPKEKQKEDSKPTVSFGRKVAIKFASFLFNLKLTLQDAYRLRIFNLWFSSRLKRRYAYITKRKGELFCELTMCALSYPKDLDKVMYFVFKQPVPTGTLPLEDKFRQILKKIDVDFYYGDSDWMDSTGARRIRDLNKERVGYYIVRGSGHNFIVELPEQTARIWLMANKPKRKIEEKP